MLAQVSLSLHCKNRKFILKKSLYYISIFFGDGGILCTYYLYRLDRRMYLHLAAIV